MSNDVKLYWHPGFGAVLCMDADSDIDIPDLLADKEVRFVKRRWSWRWFKRRFCSFFLFKA